jgi:hypothetical protein
MPLALKESIANKLLNQICSYFEEQKEISEFTRKQMLSQLNSLNEPMAYEVCYAFFECSIDEVEKGLSRFEKASLDFGYDGVVIHNYLFALGTLGKNKTRRDKAYSYALELKTPRILIDALDTAVEFKNLNQLDVLLSILQPMEVGLEQYSTNIEEAKNTMDQFSTLLDEIGISAPDLIAINDAALEVLERNGFDYIHSRISSDENEFLTVELAVNENEETLFFLNNQIMEEMIDKDLSTRIIPSFVFSKKTQRT